MRSTKVMLGCKKVVTFEDFEVRKFAPLPYKANVTLGAVRIDPRLPFVQLYIVHLTKLFIQITFTHFKVNNVLRRILYK